MNDDRPVRRCVCHDRTFVELKRLAEEKGLTTVEEIGAATGCGTSCGLCRPYLARMLQTGETAFAVLKDDIAE